MMNTPRQTDRVHAPRTLRRLPVAGAACAAAVALLIALAPGPVQASTGPETRGNPGGVLQPGSGGGESAAARFGNRTLKEGMVGPDVKVLRAMMSSRKHAIRENFLGIRDVFDRSTHVAVERFQERRDLKPNGVVNGRTSKALIDSMTRTGASWYGAPLFGNNTACGQKFTPRIVGVAHKTLPCGTRVLIGYKGRFLLTRVIDRGPYTPGRTWDLSHAARLALGYEGIDPVRHLIIGK